MIYDGYSGKYLTMNKAQKMKPKLSFHSTEEYDWDKEFEMTTGTSTQEEDKVENWRADMSKSEEDEYNRVVKGAIKVNYETRNVNNTAGKGEIGWDGVVRYPGGKPVEPVKKEKKPLFGKKKAPPKDAPKDKWAVRRTGFPKKESSCFLQIFLFRKRASRMLGKMIPKKWRSANSEATRAKSPATRMASARASSPQRRRIPTRPRTRTWAKIRLLSSWRILPSRMESASTCAMTDLVPEDFRPESSGVQLQRFLDFGVCACFISYSLFR
jgi:hypothetical protein